MCRQFELVGLLVEGRLFDPGLFLQGWGPTVLRCWQACEALVQHRRAHHGDAMLWRHFQALSELALARRRVSLSDAGGS